jgi:hypothetical protein
MYKQDILLPKKKLRLPFLTFSEEQRFSNASRNVCIGIFSLLICKKKGIKMQHRTDVKVSTLITLKGLMYKTDVVFHISEFR